MKRTWIALLAASVLLGCLAACGSAASGEAVTVQKVSMLADDGSVGLVDRYAGVVVSG